MITDYKSKYENYDIGQRLEDLRNIVRIQCEGTDLTDDYMRGMANGLLLAWTTIREPYGTEIKFYETVKK